MKCQRCSDKDATVHLKEVSGGELREIHLCESCANEKGFHLVIEHNKLSIASQFIWMAENLYPESSGKVGAVQCSGCGMRYSQFSRAGRVGCEACYDAFQPQLQKILVRVHGATRHKGRTPGSLGDAATAVETAAPPGPRISDLREKLRRAIQNEEYESAATIRDQIRELERETGRPEEDA